MGLTNVDMFRIDGSVGSASNIQTAALNGGPLGGSRNRVINGDMRIDQRNAGVGVTPTNSQYLVDRWFYGTTQAGKATSGQGTLGTPVGYSNYLAFTSTSAYSVLAGDIFYFAQAIEGLNVSDLAWGTASAQPVTLSFLAFSNLTGTFGGALKNSVGDRSYPFSYSIPAANTWTQVSVTIAGDTSGTWLTTNGVGLFLQFGLGVGATFSGTAGSWAGANYVSSTGATSVVGTSGANFLITGVQLEPGTVATPFERRSYGQELALCQRYYETLNGGTVKAAGYGTSGAEGSRQYFGFAITKRASPTMTFPTLGAANCTVISNSSANGFNVTATVTSTGTFGYDYSAGTVAASIEL